MLTRTGARSFCALLRVRHKVQKKKKKKHHRIYYVGYGTRSRSYSMLGATYTHKRIRIRKKPHGIRLNYCASRRRIRAKPLVLWCCGSCDELVLSFHSTCTHHITRRHRPSNSPSRLVNYLRHLNEDCKRKKERECIVVSSDWLKIQHASRLYIVHTRSSCTINNLKICAIFIPAYVLRQWT